MDHRKLQRDLLITEKGPLDFKLYQQEGESSSSPPSITNPSVAIATTLYYQMILLMHALMEPPSPVLC